MLRSCSRPPNCRQWRSDFRRHQTHQHVPQPTSMQRSFLPTASETLLREAECIHKDTNLARPNHKVAQEPLMILEVPDYPNATVNKQQNPRFIRRLLRGHDV